MGEVGPTAQGFAAYSLTKAILHKYTEISARENPTLKVSVCTPGFSATNKIVKRMGARRTPEEGAESTLHCLFAELEGSGFYYGSDCVRSPLHFMRHPGEPAFTGY